MICIRNANLRPGVYSHYQIHTRFGAPRSHKGAAVLFETEKPLASTVQEFTTTKQVQEMLGGDPQYQPACAACRYLLEAGVSPVFFSGVNTDYQAAAARLNQMAQVGIVIAVPPNGSMAERLLEEVEAASKAQYERLLVLGAEPLRLAENYATNCNHPRAVVVTPAVEFAGTTHPLISAAAVAAQILTTNQPNYNWNGAVLGNVHIADPLTEEHIQSMIAAGVTPLEPLGGQVQIVRAVTTCTQIAGESDYSYRSVNTILIIDEVLDSLRRSLRKKLAGIHTTPTMLGSIAAQVVLELAAQQKAGLLAQFLPPKVHLLPHDPTVCVIELTFEVAHVVSQIVIAAEVQL